MSRSDIESRQKKMTARQAAYSTLQEKASQGKPSATQGEFEFGSDPPTIEQARAKLAQRAKETKEQSERNARRVGTAGQVRARSDNHGKPMLKIAGKRSAKKPHASLGMRVLCAAVGCMLCVLLVGSLPHAYGDDSMDVGSPWVTPAVISVEAGMSARQVSLMLQSANVVDSAARIEEYLVSHGLEGRIQQGVFEFRESMGLAEIVRLLTTPASMSDSLRVWPGDTIAGIDKRLSLKGLCRLGDFERAVDAVVSSMGLPFAEGWLLAGMYPLSEQADLEHLASLMITALFELLQSHVEEMDALDRSPAEIVIIASMIQRETQNAAEMGTIAGVIYNRLDAGMPLGIDATTRYELDNWETPLQGRDFEEYTPYNTRRVPGLPPSGIGSLSIEAVHAAVHPENHQWLYYLHGEDGRLHLAKTYDGHLEHIRQFLP